MASQCPRNDRRGVEMLSPALAYALHARYPHMAPASCSVGAILFVRRHFVELQRAARRPGTHQVLRNSSRSSLQSAAHHFC